MTRAFNAFRIVAFVLILVSPHRTVEVFSQDPGNSEWLELVNDRAIRERCIELAPQFKHKGVALQSRFAFGYVIASDIGQRVVVMPNSILEPIKFPNQDKDVSIPVTYLLASRTGGYSSFRYRESVFSTQLENFPISAVSTAEKTVEAKIRRALLDRGEVHFNGTPLSTVIKIFGAQFDIPILIDTKALQERKLTIDEPVTIELPVVSVQSALNLILEPLELTFVIENEVLMITSKFAAQTVARESPVDLEEPSGAGAIVYGMPPTNTPSLISRVQRYKTLLEAQRAGLPPKESQDTSGMMRTQEFATLCGPLLVHANSKLGIAFVSMPGDFPARQIQANPVTIENKNLNDVQYVMGEKRWFAISATNTSELPVENGSLIVNSLEEPVGMYVDKKVVTFQQILQELISFDSASLGYWGAEARSSELDSSRGREGLPELFSDEIKAQINRAGSLEGIEKTAAMKVLRMQFDVRVHLRDQFAARKLESLRNKINQLTVLTERMKQEDINEANKVLLKDFWLVVPVYNEEDPFRR